jgi:predicted peroxiredoxin
MSEKLGILVTSGKYADAVIRLARAALDLGQEVSIFLTDDGTTLIRNETISQLMREGARISACGHSAEERNIRKDEVESTGIRFATQFENAVMAQESKRYVVF